MADIDLDAALRVAVDAARVAGAIIADAWGNGAKGEVTKSSHVDLVTETDKKCEDVIRTRLMEAFPAHSFIGEEEAAEAGGAVTLTDEPTWMVSPQHPPPPSAATPHTATLTCSAARMPHERHPPTTRGVWEAEAGARTRRPSGTSRRNPGGGAP
jgi:3'-phosphoadenosine 5'-phosphosulfate (PAPS) 3'-phosphatase